jgi:hypothetical protein
MILHKIVNMPLTSASVRPRSEHWANGFLQKVTSRKHREEGNNAENGMGQDKVIGVASLVSDKVNRECVVLAK